MHESRAVDQSDQESVVQVISETSSSSEKQPDAGAALDRSVLFFDGVCGLCNRSVNFAMARDRAGRLLYSPLQGETAAALLQAEDLKKLDTVIFRRGTDGRLYRRSAAIVRVLWLLGVPWQICGWLLWLIPLPIRDWGYRLVSRSRYRLFGQHETCRLPTPAERARFLP